MEPSPAPNGCTGLCCVVLKFNRPVEDLRSGKVIDGKQIADMIIPITNEEAAERMKRFGSPLEPPVPGDEEEGKLFKCKHWNEDTRLCGIYPDRPLMCRAYPYGRPCEQGCSCKD